MAAPHKGSWFGLPDFGITEAVGGLFGAPRTAQGGSNLYGSPTKQSASTLGATTTSGPGGAYPIAGGGPTNTSSGGTYSTGTTSTAPAPSYSQPSGPSYEDQVRNDINSGYDSYFSELDNIMNSGLPSQRTAQEGIVQSQYNQGVSNLGTQKTLGVQDLNTQRTKATNQQSKTLQDLSDNIRNLFTSGNVYLGAKGAGDSSASNQYSYALTKLGSKQRGDVTAQYADINNDINGRETRLNELYNSQVNDLGFQRDQQINGIAQWFGEQQNALRQAKAQGQLNKGQDLAQLSQQLLNQAMQQLSMVQQEASNKRSALDEWAMNHSNDINSLKSNLASVSQTNYAMPEASPVNGMPATAAGAGNPSLFGYGGNEDPRTNIFGQRIS